MHLPFFQGKKDISVKWHDKFASKHIADVLLTYLSRLESRPIVFFCVGTDRSTGDALGPLVGSLLTEKKLPSNFIVQGTLEEPIHAVNLTEKINRLFSLYQDPFIIGIDACLGKSTSVGTIQIKDGPLKPGAGVKKQLPSVGEIHIAGVVNISGFMEYFVLQNTRLHLVMNLAETIADGIYKAGLLYRLKYQLNPNI